MKAKDFKFDRSLFHLYQVVSQQDVGNFQDYVEYLGYDTKREYQKESPEEFQKVKVFFENTFRDIMIISSHGGDDAVDQDPNDPNHSLDYEFVGYNHIRMFRLDEDVAMIFLFKN